jgi:putative membrane protein
MRRSHSLLRLARWLPLVSALACHSGPAPKSGPAPVSRIARIADANTLALLLATNSVDLAYARVGTSRATHQGVKTLARRMQTDFTLLNVTLRQLVARLEITPREDEISRLLRDQSATRRDSLRALSGREFDSAYVANELRFHRELLIAFDQALLPSAQRAALREYVATVRPMLVAHIAHAEQVQGSLGAIAGR